MRRESISFSVCGAACHYGIFTSKGIEVLGIPLVELFFAVIPTFFYILAFIMMLARTRKHG